MKMRYHFDGGNSWIGIFCLKGCWMILAAAFLLGMTYLWIYSQVVQTSTLVERFERKLDYLSGRSVILQSQLEKLQSPAVIEKMLIEKKIALVDPYPEQIVRVRQEETRTVKEASAPHPPQDFVGLSIAR